MFTSKVRFLLSQLEASNSDIAHYMAVNPSVVSRIRTGTSKPQKNSQAIQHFINGVYEFASHTNRLSILYSIIGDTIPNEQFQTKEALKLWLYNPEKTNLEKNGKSKSYFGKKLTSLMSLLNISNIKLAKALNVDPSYISHFRSGKRVPQINNRIFKDLCEFLTNQIKSQKKYNELRELVLYQKPIPTNQEEIKQILITWLSDTGTRLPLLPVGNLFEQVSDLNIKIDPLPKISEIATEEIMHSSTETYHSTEGMRHAVLRLLTTAILKGSEVWLYSDQSIDWMTEESNFLPRWSALMNHCISSGLKIKVIHNIHRENSELLSCIKFWLPLYLSGKIDSYYCKKEADVRFSNTLFICPGVCAIEATHVRGFEKYGNYKYYTTSYEIFSLQKQFDGLMKYSAPLLKSFTLGDRDNFLFCLSHLPIEKGNCLLSTLPVSTMSQQLVNSIIEKHSFTKEEKDAFLTFWKIQRNYLMHCLENGNDYTHCLPLFDKKTILAGKVPLDLNNIAINKEIYYDIEEYKTHLKNILSLYQSYDNFHILLQETEYFHNMQVRVGDKHVIVLKNDFPQTAFIFTNPILQRVLQLYQKQLLHKYNISSIEITRNILEHIFRVDNYIEQNQ
ncbi:helix-turn-helix transcriptional regulator [Streptococcus suis]|uniref:helix-turn-helix domain-containing protein n=1 Tax=Streptococcus parasuis TaxID=1501662 RepID=UPI00155547CE|nr:helix-turn-helix transcriptional regulator [Streptococcus suis]WNF86060.1 helix-turn-helix transcriptional regulator [Streptococcus parasuis]